MNLTLTHQKKPALGWDISASAAGEKDEKISRAEILVNNASKYDKKFNPPLAQWQQQLDQQGQYPGDNTSELRLTSNRNTVSVANDGWS